MRRLVLALVTGILLLLLAGVGTATAGTPEGQSTGQSAGSDQAAGTVAGSAQQETRNGSSPEQVVVPADGGSVSEVNEAASDAEAANLNGTEQTAGQIQSGCCGGTQVIGQSAENDQDALALALTYQAGASNANAPVSVLSPGGDGAVSQSNEASSDAAAGNVNGTKQAAAQVQGGGLGHDGGSGSCQVCGGGAGSQVIGQSADSDQAAGAVALTEQEGASNENISVRVLSPGSNGPVSQSNAASSSAAAGNVNGTQQLAGQVQGGGCCGGSQVIGQSAESDQEAGALAATKQVDPSNRNISVRVLSPGGDGAVSQSNEASSDAAAGNVNGTKQAAAQVQGGGLGHDGGSGSCQVCGGGAGSQVIGQSADSDQAAGAVALTEQEGASNENISVRVLSPGSNGPVSQSNAASSSAAAGNVNGTQQLAGQVQGGGCCGGSQVIGQSAESDQEAGALAATKQVDPSNRNISVRVLSPGGDGAVSQSNEASSDAAAGNVNGTKQAAAQGQGGSGLQVIGQEAKSDQHALAGALTVQLGAANENAPVRVLSPGGGGPVSQTNSATSNAAAGNLDYTGQYAAQKQGGSERGCCGSGIQAIGQSAQNDQGAVALAGTVQVGSRQPCGCGMGYGLGNSSTPTRVLSPGHDGPVTQANIADSNATAVNWNETQQAASQTQDRPVRCVCFGGDAIQAIGQLSGGYQSAAAIATTLQLGARNHSAPVRTSSPGSGHGMKRVEPDAADHVDVRGAATDQLQTQNER
jgi:hypothetical protein